MEDRDSFLLIGPGPHRLVGDREITAIRAALRRDGDPGARCCQGVAGLKVATVVIDRVVDAIVIPIRDIHLRPGHDKAAVGQRLNLCIQHGVASGDADIQGLDDVVVRVQHPDDAVIQRAGWIPGDIVAAGLLHVLHDRVAVTQLLQTDVDSHLDGGVGGTARDRRAAIKASTDVEGDSLAAVVPGGIGRGNDEVIAALDSGAVQRDDAGGGVDGEIGEAVRVQAIGDRMGVRGVGVVHLGASRRAANNGGAGSGGAACDNGRGVVHNHAAAGNDGNIACRVHGISVVSAFGETRQRQRGAGVCRDGDAVHQVIGSVGEAAQIRHGHA
ncbi:TPA: hypothetical protein I8287_004729, partial [Kluyvera intermedia]|nr:hypothetical protein [Kluyvera intermedia]